MAVFDPLHFKHWHHASAMVYVWIRQRSKTFKRQQRAQLHFFQFPNTFRMFYVS